MTPNDLDELSKKLFDAARNERATNDVLSRTLRSSLAAARTENRSRVPVIVTAVAFAAGVAGLVWFGERSVTSTSIVREKVSGRPAAATPTSNPRETPRQPSDVPTATIPSKRVATSRSSSSTERAPASLSEELALLESARTALANGSSERALELLDRYERSLRGTHLRAEASILRLEALAKAGRNVEAAALAREFVNENPGSPFVDRARFFAGGEEGPEHRDSGRAP